ncbi:MAG: hypothetical protein PWP14_2398 [Methanolobus sp.]|nr:hypothetical protein [Methanolobus sp.]
MSKTVTLSFHPIIERFLDWLHMLRLPASPEGYGVIVAKDPLDSKVQHCPAMLFLHEVIYPAHSFQILLVSWRLELRVGLLYRMAAEIGILSHFPRQQALAEGPVCHERYVILLAEWQYTYLNRSLEYVVRGLGDIDLCLPAKLIRLLGAEVTDPDSPYGSFFLKLAHEPGRFLHRMKRVRPVDMENVYVVRAKPLE